MKETWCAAANQAAQVSPKANTAVAPTSAICRNRDMPGPLACDATSEAITARPPIPTNVVATTIQNVAPPTGGVPIN